ncbi:MAG: polysaccharide biosynthesis/export family protein [Acidobacteriota bacterium]
MNRFQSDRRPEIRVLVSALLLAAAVGLPAVVVAQSGTPTLATREQLDQRSQELEARLEAGGLEQEERARLAADLERVRTRLEEGDFRPGDVVAMEVWGNDELSGEFTVDADGRVQLAGLDPVSLDGVLYAEADSVIREHLEQFLRDVRVQVRPLKRVAVLGAVSSPGFYDLGPSASVSDALMAAGGPVQDAEMDDLELRRDGRNLFEDRSGDVQSLSLADLGLRRGDQFFVPQRGQGIGFMTVVGVISGLGTAAYGISRIF